MYSVVIRQNEWNMNAECCSLKKKWITLVSRSNITFENPLEALNWRPPLFRFWFSDFKFALFSKRDLNAWILITEVQITTGTTSDTSVIWFGSVSDLLAYELLDCAAGSNTRFRVGATSVSLFRSVGRTICGRLSDNLPVISPHLLCLQCYLPWDFCTETLYQFFFFHSSTRRAHCSLPDSIIVKILACLYMPQSSLLQLSSSPLMCTNIFMSALFSVNLNR
jgi:hypothetical protein